MSINRVTISGNLTRDSELRATASGTSVLNFGVAVNDRRRNAQGEWEDYPNFIDCVMFGTRADSLARYLTKGTKVALDGRLHYSSWETDGQRRSKIEVVVNDVDFMSTRRSDQPQQGGAPRESFAAPAPRQSAAPTSAPAQKTPPSADVYSDDLPF